MCVQSHCAMKAKAGELSWGALHHFFGEKDILFLTSAILKLHISKTHGFNLNIPKTLLKFLSPDLG